MSAYNIKGNSNNKIPQLFSSQSLKLDPQRPSRHTELKAAITAEKQLGLNLSNLDRQLTNEIGLLKMSIRKSLGMPVNARIDVIKFDKLKQAGAGW